MSARGTGQSPDGPITGSMSEITPTYPSERPRYASLQDYIKVIRRRRRLIGLITIAFAAGSLLWTYSKHPVYEASTQLQARDPLQNLPLFGGKTVIPQQTPNQRAATYAQLATSRKIVAKVRDELNTKLSIYQLQSAITTQVGVQTGLVELSARSGSPDFAARLANADAKAVQRAAVHSARKLLAKVEAGFEEQIAAAEKASVPIPGAVGYLKLQLAQVRATEKVVNPVTIIERAQAPGAPTSPHHKEDVGIGVALGLVFGLIGAFLRDALDRRFRSAAEIQEQLGVPVLGRISETSFGFPGLARNGYTMDEADFEAFRVLRMNLSYLSEHGSLRSILVTSGLPEEGKSTVSMSLASAVALTGQRVLLVECDLRRPSFARRVGIRPQPGLTDYLMGKASPQEILQTVQVTPPTSANGRAPGGEQGGATLVCIAAGSHVSTAPELLLSDRFNDLLEKTSKVYDLVILDGSPLLAVSDPLEVVPQVDGVLVCIRAQQTTHEQARASRAALGHLPRRPTGAVLTGIRRGDPDAYDYYYGY